MAVFAEFSLWSLQCVQMKDECEIAEQCGWSLWLYLLIAPSHFAFVIEHQFTAQRIMFVPLHRVLLCFFFGSCVCVPSCVANSISTAAVRGEALQDDAPCPSAFRSNYLLGAQ